MKPKKQCNKPTCRRLIDFNNQYCTEHKPKTQRKQQSYAERMATDRQYRLFYKSKAWQQLSFQYRLNNPICEECLLLGIASKANVTDHIIEIKDDWSKRLDSTNLQALCHHHHEVKTQKERVKRSSKTS